MSFNSAFRIPHSAFGHPPAIGGNNATSSPSCTCASSFLLQVHGSEGTLGERAGAGEILAHPPHYVPHGGRERQRHRGLGASDELRVAGKKPHPDRRLRRRVHAS